MKRFDTNGLPVTTFTPINFVLSGDKQELKDPPLLSALATLYIRTPDVALFPNQRERLRIKRIRKS